MLKPVSLKTRSLSFNGVKNLTGAKTSSNAPFMFIYSFKAITDMKMLTKGK